MSQQDIQNRPSRRKGMSLIELMVALVISSIVMIGVVTVYSSSKRSYLIQEEFARMQENARFAFNAIAREVRQAGFSGCNPTINNMLDTTHAAYSDKLFDFVSGIDGWEFNGTAPGNSYTITDLTDTGAAGNWTANGGGGLPAPLQGNVVVGNDVLVVKSSVTLDSLIPSGNTPANAAAITFGAGVQTGVPAGTIVIFSDCDKADVFQNGSNANANALTRPVGAGGFDPGNVNPASANFSHSFNTNARVQIARTQVFFIGVGANGGPALFRADFNQGAGAVVTQEIVEGIENMQVLYGIDTTPNDTDIMPNRYVAGGAGVNPDNIVSVRISLLVHTPEELFRQNDVAQAHRLLGVDAATGVDITNIADQRSRKVFTTTILLRNKTVTRTAFGS